MERSERPPGEEAFDDDEALEDEGFEEDGPIYAEGDGPAPAASLTSIRLTRRRSRAKAPAQTPRGETEGRSKPPEQASRAPAVPAPAVVPPEPSAAPRPSSIIDYWSRLRGERPHPAPAELDPGLIAASWPNAMLLRRHDGETGLRAAALYRPEGGPRNPSDHTLDLSPMVVEWILSLGEEALRGAQPIAEKESFERPSGSVWYAACALPLGEVGAEADHVLCYLRVLS